MIELTDISQLVTLPGPLHVCLGMFDGIHRGHQSLFAEACRCKNVVGGFTAALTFHPHPSFILRPASRPSLLTGPRHRVKLLEKQGLDAVVLQTFDLPFSRLSATGFLDWLRESCQNLSTIITGPNFRFGQGGAGDIHLLKQFGIQAGIQTVVTPPVEDRGIPISSTRIRELVAKGDLEAAHLFLGRPYSVFGQVVEGRKWARTVGFPTANYVLDNELLPPLGVWTFITKRGGRNWYGLGNLGLRPTFGGELHPVLEVHWLDEEADLYGEWMELEFGRFLRPEKKFGSPDELAGQIALDAASARRWRDEVSGVD